MIASDTIPQSLKDWLQTISRTHHKSIQLGLDRMLPVYQSLVSLYEGRTARTLPKIITFAGTNGKGSTLAMVEAIALQSGKRVGAYTSPHLLRFNERIRVNGNEVSDNQLISGFTNVEQLRSGNSLTYFEYTTLVAFDLFLQADLDIWLLEVGLGGRLDAVNIIDPDIAVITTVDLDHQEWLGDNREDIGFEKAGILRPRIPLILGCSDPPASVLKRAADVSADVYTLEQDFVLKSSRFESYRTPGSQLELSIELQTPPDLPPGNIAAALQVARAAQLNLRGVALAPFPELRLVGRFQQVSTNPEVILDVAHNPHAARYLSDWLSAQPAKSTGIAVFSALRDKDIVGVISELADHFHQWHLFQVDDSRAALVNDLAEILESVFMSQKKSGSIRVIQHAKAEYAYQQALDAAGKDGRIVVFGSFMTVAAVLETGMI